jgi:uridine nucleosidase
MRWSLGLGLGRGGWKPPPGRGGTKERAPMEKRASRAGGEKASVGISASSSAVTLRRAVPVVVGASGLMMSLGSSVSLNAPQPSRRYGGGAMSGDPNRQCTDALLWANGIGYALQVLSGHAVTAMGAKVNAKIAAGQLWRFFTPVVLHGGVMHLAVNCMSLNALGPAVERQFGREQFCAVYLASALGGNYLSYRFCLNDAVGASSAIFGLVGAMGVYLHRHNYLFGDRGQAMLENLLGSVAVNAAFGMMSKRIDNYAHLGGFLAGALVSFAAGPNLVPVDAREAANEAKRAYAKTGTLPSLGIARVGGRPVVNRPIVQTYVDEFTRAFHEDDDDD